MKQLLLTVVLWSAAIIGWAQPANTDSLLRVWGDTTHVDLERAKACKGLLNIDRSPTAAAAMAERLKPIASSDVRRADLLQAVYELVARDTVLGAIVEPRLLLLIDRLDAAPNAEVRRAGRSARANYLYTQGTTYWWSSNYAKALRYYMQAWDLVSLDPTDADAVNYSKHMTGLYYDLNDRERLSRFARLGIPHAQAMGDTATVLVFMTHVAQYDHDAFDVGTIQRLGEAYYADKKGNQADEFSWDLGWMLKQQGDLKGSAEHYKALISAHGDRAPTRGYAITYWALGQVLGEMDSIPQAIASLRRAVALADELSSLIDAGRERVALGEQLVRMGGIQEAERLWLEAAEALRKLGQVEYELPAVRNLKDLYTSMGRYEAALEMTNRWVLLKDSVTNMNASRETQVMEFRNEVLADSLANALQLREEQQLAEERVTKERTRRNIFLFSGLGLLVFGVVVFRQRRRIQKALHRSDELLLNILPAEVANELKAKGHADAKHFDQVTILFTDFKGFTEASEKLSPQELVEELNTCFKAFDGIITARGIEKIKTIGDAYMCAGGLPVPASSTPVGVVHAALEMQAFMIARKRERDAQGKPAFEMRVGIHTGPAVAGIVGVKKFQYDIWGDTVNTASRMESSGEVGQVNISEATYVLVRDEPGLSFTARGKVQAKGKGEMEMYFVTLT